MIRIDDFARLEISLELSFSLFERWKASWSMLLIHEFEDEWSSTILLRSLSLSSLIFDKGNTIIEHYPWLSINDTIDVRTSFPNPC